MKYAWPWVIGVTLIALLLSKQWDMLELDESTASSLGQRVGLARTGGLIIAVILAAVIVSVIGPIGFVGLVAPHLVRLSGVRSNRLLIPGVFIWGQRCWLERMCLPKWYTTPAWSCQQGLLWQSLVRLG